MLNRWANWVFKCKIKLQVHRVGGIHSQEQADGGAGAASAGLWGDAASSAGSSSQCEEATGTPIFSVTLRRAVIILHLAQRFFITTFFRFIYVCLFFFRNRRKKKVIDGWTPECKASVSWSPTGLFSQWWWENLVLSALFFPFRSLDTLPLGPQTLSKSSRLSKHSALSVMSQDDWGGLLGQFAKLLTELFYHLPKYLNIRSPGFSV